MMSRERTELTTGTLHDPDRLSEGLATAVARAFALFPAHGPDNGGRLLRVAVPADGIEPLRWLGAQEKDRRMYWSGRDGGFEVASIGVADEVVGSPDAVSGRLARADERSRVRYFGGMRFDASVEPDEGWASFGAARFVLPRYELRREGGRTELACYLILPRDLGRRDEIVRGIQRLGERLGERSGAASSGPSGDASGGMARGLPALLSRSDEPGWAGWRDNIQSALAAFRRERLGKVVLARRAGLRFAGRLDGVRVLEDLEASTPGCFHFLFEDGEGRAFVGASPERLFKREERRLYSEAVAGTRPRSESEADDEELREDLLSSHKDLAEQAFVRISIREALEGLCETLQIEDRASEMRLARGRHLVSGVEGVLRAGVTDAEVLGAMHPTPAVGGYPTQEALEKIRALEGFDRGWYAGPVGWLGSEGAEFAVGIRSGLVDGDRLSLYSGAGIVSGSTPEGEWAEIEHKIGDFLRVFGLDPTSRHAAS